MRGFRVSNQMEKTVFATLCDVSQYTRALGTLRDLRQSGKWSGSVVLLCVDFEPAAPPSDVEMVALRHLDHSLLWEAWKTHPISPLPDDRHYKKTYQWDKLQVFGPWCQKWHRVVFLDAGTSVLSPVEPLLQLEWRGAFLAMQDGAPRDLTRIFRTQLDLEANPEVTADLIHTFGAGILGMPYFLNCFFIFDTNVAVDAFANMCDWMRRFPIMMCNEMGIMNLYFAMRTATWRILPTHRVCGGPLLGYTNYDFPGLPVCDVFCLLKY